MRGASFGLRQLAAALGPMDGSHRSDNESGSMSVGFEAVLKQSPAVLRVAQSRDKTVRQAISERY
jgi:ABC-type Fe3+-citrate transport system substrate-binding protein